MQLFARGTLANEHADCRVQPPALGKVCFERNCFRSFDCGHDSERAAESKGCQGRQLHFSVKRPEVDKSFSQLDGSMNHIFVLDTGQSVFSCAICNAISMSAGGGINPWAGRAAISVLAQHDTCLPGVGLGFRALRFRGGLLVSLALEGSLLRCRPPHASVFSFRACGPRIKTRTHADSTGIIVGTHLDQVYEVFKDFRIAQMSHSLNSLKRVT